jgi:lactoylglutathione lyase
MLTMVGTITVYVTDQDKALAFYTEKLGFETRADMPTGTDQRWIEVAPSGARHALYCISRLLMHHVRNPTKQRKPGLAS